MEFIKLFFHNVLVQFFKSNYVIKVHFDLKKHCQRSQKLKEYVPAKYINFLKFYEGMHKIFVSDFLHNVLVPFFQFNYLKTHKLKEHVSAGYSNFLNNYECMHQIFVSDFLMKYAINTRQKSHL